MAGLVVTQEGARTLWQWMLTILAPTIPNLHLMGSPHTAIHTDTAASLAAVELPTAAGYAPIPLSSPASKWTFTFAADGCVATYDQVSWTFTGALTVYGYWLTDATNTFALWAESFNPAYTFPSGGGVFPLKLPPLLFSAP